jgi:hypothetical protein
MNSKKISVTIGIVLAVAFFASLIAALSKDEEYENKLNAKDGKEYNCPAAHEGMHAKEGCKCCCCPAKCAHMKCDTSMCATMHEKCAKMEQKCEPSECPHHADKNMKMKEEKKCDPSACVKHEGMKSEGNTKCDPKTCTGKCPKKAAEGK